jgi:RNA ligase partner protein
MVSARSRVERLVLDTSVFVNPEVRHLLGKTPTDALERFMHLVSQTEGLEFYMPPSIFEELMNFVQRDKVPGKLFHYLTLRAPSLYEIFTPAVLFYELIEDIRERVNKGLRIAEKAIRTVSKEGIDETVRDLRRKYRDALREGIVDSKEDIDLILLAKELDGLLVSADAGAVAWAGKLGVKWLLPEKLVPFLESAVKS